MRKENPVFNVIVTEGDQALLAAGSKMDSLKGGQLGIFNVTTGLSVGAASPVGDLQTVVIAVGTGAAAGQPALDVSTSAGQHIQTKKVEAYTIKPYAAEVAKVIDVYDYKAMCDTDYVLVIQVDNYLNYQLNGTNALKKPFSFHTECCTGCEDCDTLSDPAALAAGLVKGINNDPDKLVTAALFVNRSGATFSDPSADGTAVIAVGTEKFSVDLVTADTPTTAGDKIAAKINGTTTSKYYATNAAGVVKVYSKNASKTATPAITVFSAGGTGLTAGTAVSEDSTITDAAAFALAAPGVAPIIRITGVIPTRKAVSGVNANYQKAGTNFLVTLRAGFECNGKFVDVTQPIYPEGMGIDVLQDEYIAQGWGKAGPYRTNAISGLPNSVDSFANGATNYTTVILNHPQDSSSGWKQYENDMETRLFIPCGDSTTLAAFVAVTDVMFANKFGVMANDIAGVDCTNAPTSTLTPSTDGIEAYV